jgi:hypothetical protein
LTISIIHILPGGVVVVFLFLKYFKTGFNNFLVLHELILLNNLVVEGRNAE